MTNAPLTQSIVRMTRRAVLSEGSTCGPVVARVASTALLGTMLLSTGVSAQQTAAVDLKGTPAAFTVGTDAGKDVAIEIPKIGHVIVVLKCVGDFDCTTVAIETSQSAVMAKQSASKAEARFYVPGGPTPTTFTGTVKHGSTAAGNKLTFTGAGGGGGASPAPKLPTFADSIAILLATPCRLDSAELERTDRFLVTAFGRVLVSQRSFSATEDTARVSVVIHPRLADLTTPRAGSALAEPLVANIYGQDLDFFKLTSRTGRDTLRAAADTILSCAVTPAAMVGPFASPKGVVNITVFDGKPETKVGSFEFGVRPTYTGTFAFGGVTSRAADPTFDKVYNGTDTVVTSRDGGPRALFVATYTHFLTGRRDLTRPPASPLGWVNPVVGDVLNDIANNLLYGIALEVRPGFTLTIGQHLARVKGIDPQTGVVPGDPFENRAATVPTSTHWTSKPFYGALVDARAAGGLIKSLWAAAK